MKGFLASLTLLTAWGALPAAAQQAPAAPATAATASAPVPYRINPGDEIEVFVWGEERLQRSVRVLPDGSFSFPLVGKVNALNSLPTEIEAKISKGLEPQYRGAVPQVTVTVKSAAGMQFSVIGKVRNPGSFTPGRYVNALEALSLAGGASEFAQLSNVVIIRKAGTGLETIRVRLNDVMKGSVNDVPASGIPVIQGGDTVIVP